MLLGIFTIVIMLAVGYAFLREGLFTSFCMCFNVILAGLIAFNFWEPLADQLGSVMPSYQPPGLPPYFWGYEDALILMVLFWAPLGLLRLLTNSLAPAEIQYHGYVRSGGAALIGMVNGYLLCGFIICVMQTLPWHQNFMLFEPAYKSHGVVRRVLPPDEVWLALMHRAGCYALSNDADEDVPDTAPVEERYQTFDRNGSFEVRYGRYRRYDDSGSPKPYLGEYEFERTGQRVRAEQEGPRPPAPAEK